jgi:polyphosphate glucokinase
VGITFPAVVRNGVTFTAANVDDAWIGFDARKHFEDVLGLEATVLNDADAAGVAEVAFGAGKGLGGTLVVLTFGTGIGSAIFVEGKLLPNTELGHIELHGREVEPWASDRARTEENLSWKKWAKRVDEYLNYLDMLFSPDLFILGGGVSKRADKFLDKISTRARVVPAELLNEAGIVGAAYAATHRFHATVRVEPQRRP